MRPNGQGWTGSSVNREVYSSHADIVLDDGNGGSSWTVCDGHDFRSTFVLQRPS